MYKSRYEEYGHENTKLQSGCEERDRQISKLQEDSRIAHELVASYKQLTEMYEGQQQQQSSYNMGQGWPLLPQYPGQSHSSPFYLLQIGRAHV